MHELSDLREEAAIYKLALEEIVEKYGKVCEQYEICKCKSCWSSYCSWATANEALRKGELFRP